jgi:putative redox protein
MIIEVVKQKEGNFRFEGVNEQGNKANMDGSPAIGGENLGVRPMEMLIMGLGGCSGIDVLSILRKQRQEPTEFKMVINADRQAEAVPSLFEKIHIEFTIKGVPADKAEKAIQLSLEKYCSVAKTLEKTATITYTLIS